MTSFIPTDEQQAICQAAAKPEPLMVQAYAGTAKTTSLVLAAPQIRVPALALAFNRRIAQEIKDKLPGNWRTLTLNGLGQLAWARALPAQVKLELDDRKLGKLVSAGAKVAKIDLSSEQWAQTRQLCQLAMQAGLSPDNEGSPLVADSPETWQELAFEAWMLDDATRPMLVELARNVLQDSIALAKQGQISYDDQIYCPTILGGAWPKFPAAAVDESQDLSPLNQRMIQLATRPDAKLLLVGDSRQAIYAWRGADAQAMQSMRGLRPGWQDLALTMTFRCPKLIVARQQSHAPGFRAWQGVAQGAFCKAAKSIDGGWSWKQFRGLASGTAAVLCRANAPLLSLAFKLIRQQVGPVMAGRDLGKGLAALVKKIQGKDSTLPIELFLGKLEEWELSERSAAVSNGHEAQADSIADRAECLRAVADGCQASSSSELLRGIEMIFAKESGDLTLSSIYRAKGLEWELVMHLDPWRLPSSRAKAAARDGDERQLEQEWNLKYVAETRTKHTLVEANLEDFQ